MRAELIVLALCVGAATYGFRYLPLRMDLGSGNPGGWLQRFFAATGPAAIATLFVASILPLANESLRDVAPVAGGVLAVLGGFGVTRSVVIATLAGAVAHGLVAVMA